MQLWLEHLSQLARILRESARAPVLLSGCGGSGARQPLELFQLESRVLLSGTPVVLPQLGTTTSAGLDSADVSPDSTDPEFDWRPLGEIGTLLPLTERLGRHELLVIDKQVDNHQLLLDELRLRLDDTDSLEIVLLDDTADGVAQISAALSRHSGLDAVHLIAHGTSGGVQLGNAWLNSDSWETYRSQLETWQRALSPTGDLLLYGCDFASTESGRALADSLSTLLQVDVAASDDATGHDSLGGDWELEYVVGTIEALPLFSESAQPEWYGLLASHVFQQNVGGYTGTVDTYVSSSDPNDSFGTGKSISVDADEIEYGLIRFSNLFGSGAGQIPFGATIVSAELIVNVTNDTGSAGFVSLHPMLQNWTAGATWNSFGGNGIQFDDVEATTAADSILVDSTAKGAHSFDGLASTVQAWLDGAPNYGWAIESDHNDSWAIDSAEEQIAGRRPLLSVVYTLPGIDTSGPDLQHTTLNTPLVFSTSDGNALTVTDGSLDDSILRVTLAATNGTVTLSSVAGLTLEAGADGTAALTVRGLESDLNAALEGLTFTPDNGYQGAASLQLTSELAADLAVGLEAQYTFDDGTHIGHDDSLSGGHDGTLLDDAQQVNDSERGNVLSLDGSNDAIQIAGLLDEPANVTLSGWAYLDSQDGALISLGGNVGIRFDLLGGVYGYFHQNILSQPTTYANVDLTDTGWHHLAFTFDDANNEQVLYVDGQVVATSNHSASISWSQGTNTFIGKNSQSTLLSGELEGRVDDVRVYDRALTAGEITALASERTADSQLVSINIAGGAINAPVNPLTDADATVNQVSEHAAASTVVGITARAVDPDGTDTVSYSLLDSAAGRFSIDAVSGVVVVADPALVDFEDAAGYTITVLAHSSDATITTQSFQIAVLPINEAPIMVSANSVTVLEGQTAVLNVLASDPDLPGDTLTYSIIGGADQHRFALDASTGELTFHAAPHHNAPTDDDLNNVYQVQVQAADGAGASVDQLISVTVVPPLNHAPQIVSDGGGDFATIRVDENTRHVTKVTASDADSPAQRLEYTIVGGADAGQFTVGRFSGNLVFATAPNFESPLDSDGNNLYEVSVRVSDGQGGHDLQQIRVSVVDSDELLDQLTDLISADPLANVVEVLSGASGTPLIEPSSSTPPRTPQVEIEVAVTDPPPPTAATPTGDGPATAGAETLERATVERPQSRQDVGATITPSSTLASPLASLSTTVVTSAAAEGSSAPAAYRQMNIAFSNATDQSFELREVSLDSSLFVDSSPTFDFISPSGGLWNELDAFRDTMVDDIVLDDILVGSAGGVFSSLTVGYVVWVLRGGVLLSTLLAQMPAWRLVDPIAIFSSPGDEDDTEDDESLESIVDGQDRQPTPAADDGEQIETPPSAPQAT